jgi:hypothetical protein
MLFVEQYRTKYTQKKLDRIKIMHENNFGPLLNNLVVVEHQKSDTQTGSISSDVNLTKTMVVHGGRKSGD